jgi:hypothetical protein
MHVNEYMAKVAKKVATVAPDTTVVDLDAEIHSIRIGLPTSMYGAVYASVEGGLWVWSCPTDEDSGDLPVRGVSEDAIALLAVAEDFGL